MFFPSNVYEGLKEYEPGEVFLSRLQAYDASLKAYKDYKDQAVIVFSQRNGVKVLELKVRRKEGQLWTEIENKIIAQLPQMDVWRRLGKSADAGLALDDELNESVESEKERTLATNKENRLYKLKNDVDEARLKLGFRSRKVSFHQTLKKEH